MATSTVDLSSFTDEQKKLFNQAESLGGGVNTINSSTLTQQPTQTFQPTQQPPIYPVAGLGGEPLLATAQEGSISNATDSLQSLIDSSLGESQYRAEKKNEAGYTDMAKTIQDQSARLKALQNEAIAIPLQLQQDATGRGITEGGLRPIQTASLRNNAIQSLSVASQLEASRGNMTLALDLVDRAVAQRFDPIREKIAAAQANLKLLIDDPRTGLQDRNRAAAQKALQDAKSAQVEGEAARQKEIYDIAMTAAKYGADPQALDKIMKTTDRKSALLAASAFLQDPKAKYELESSRLDNIFKQAQIAKTRRESSLLGQMTPADLKAEKEAMGKARAAVPILKEKVALVDSLIGSSGMTGSVGVYGISRWTPFSADKAERVNFIGGVEQLRAREFIDAVIAMKTQGGTLGALNEQEGEQLRLAASKIAQWALKDDKGRVYGYEASEGDMTAELEKIKRLATTAMTAASGSSFSSDESSLLDQAFDSSNNFDASSYYSTSPNN